MIDGEEIRQRRKALGWTRDDLASRLMRVSKRSLRAYETGQRNIPSRKAKMIDKMLASGERNLAETSGERCGPRYLVIPEPGEESTIRRVKTRMEEKGITPYEIEEDLGDGFAVGTIYSWLRGDSEPKASRWFRFCLYLDLAKESRDLDGVSENGHTSSAHTSSDVMALPLDYDDQRTQIVRDRPEMVEAHGQRANDVRVKRNPSNTLDGRIKRHTPIEVTPASRDDIRGSMVAEVSFEGGDASFFAVVTRVTADFFKVLVTSPREREYEVKRSDDGTWTLTDGHEVNFQVLAVAERYPCSRMTEM